MLCEAVKTDRRVDGEFWESDESHWVLWDREMTKLGLELRSMLEEIYHSIFSRLFASTRPS